MDQTKSEKFRERAQTIATTFDTIKKNPMNLNLLLAHVGVLSLTVDELLREYADMLEVMEHE
jgi:hypothetical protein